MWGDDLEEEQTLEQEFEALTQQKVALWEQVKHMPNYEFESTPQWAQIRELDAQLLTLDQKIKEGGK